MRKANIVKTLGQYIKEEMINSLAIKEMQIKRSLKYHLTPKRMAVIKKLNKNECQ